MDQLDFLHLYVPPQCPDDSKIAEELLIIDADWISDLINPGSWATVASFVALGLTWWESCLAVFVGAFLVAIVITANGIVGAKVHTPFAVTSRSVFGYWGSKFVVFSRMVIACFWLSINSWS